MTLPPADPDEPPTKPGHMRVNTLGKDGKWLHQDVKLDDEMIAMQKRVRAETKRLEEAGTPYWCIHKGRSLDHPKAKWMENRYNPGDPGYDGIHRKHGVVCTECGGYLQEG